mmetsp:Transcript_74514/g.222278  ORF Transcript_74514/g.222278 Transcript_74514/m.222278 type:complete len:203 (-) Transcript_74514:568-1176(-)
MSCFRVAETRWMALCVRATERWSKQWAWNSLQKMSRYMPRMNSSLSSRPLPSWSSIMCSSARLKPGGKSILRRKSSISGIASAAFISSAVIAPSLSLSMSITICTRVWTMSIFFCRSSRSVAFCSSCVASVVCSTMTPIRALSRPKDVITRKTMKRGTRKGWTVHTGKTRELQESTMQMLKSESMALGRVPKCFSTSAAVPE